MRTKNIETSTEKEKNLLSLVRANSRTQQIQLTISNSTNDRISQMLTRTKPEEKNVPLPKVKSIKFGNKLISSLEDICIISGDSIWMPSDITHNIENKCLIYKNNSFKLEESETLTNIERHLFGFLSEEVSNYKEKVLINLKKSANNLQSERIAQIKNSEDFSVSNYIITEVFLAEKGRVLEEETKPNVKLRNLDFKLDDLEMAEFQGGKSLAYRTLEEISKENKPTILYLFGDLYLAQQDKINLDEFPQKFKLVSTSENFSDAYDSKLNSLISERISRQINSQISTPLEIPIQKPKEVNSATQGNISFVKKSEGVYEISRKIDEFIVKKEDSNYLFPKAEIFVEVMSSSENLTLRLPAKIKGLYKHPFRRPRSDSETELCTGTLNWATYGLYPVSQSPVSFKDLRKKNFAQQIIIALDATESIMKMGVAGSSNPYTPLIKSNFSQNLISESRAKELNRNGVLIYDNDNPSSANYRK